MSVRLMVEVLDHAPRELPDVQHRALFAMAERFNDRTRSGFHPLDELAHRISRSRPTATRTLRALVERGLLEVVSKAGRGKSTVYFMPPLVPLGDGVRGDDLSEEEPKKPEKVITQDDDLSGKGSPEKVITQDDDLSAGGAPERSSFEPERSSSGAERSSFEALKVITQDDDPSLHPSYIPHHPRVRANGSPPSSVKTEPDEDEELNKLNDNPAATAAMVTLRKHTPRTITAEHAQAVARNILSGRTVDKPALYVQRAVDRDPGSHIPAAPGQTVAQALARPDDAQKAPVATGDRPAEVASALEALRARWASESRERKAAERPMGLDQFLRPNTAEGA